MKKNLKSEESLDESNATRVVREVEFARCLRCGFEWRPRKETPKRCPHCISKLWNVPRAQKLPGKPAPTRKGAPRGRAFAAGDQNPKRAAKLAREGQTEG